MKEKQKHRHGGPPRPPVGRHRKRQKFNQKGTTPQPLNPPQFQDHLVLETKPHFRIIIRLENAMTAGPTTGLCAYTFNDINRVSELIGNQLRIGFQVAHERCVRSPHDLKIAPAKANRFQLWQHRAAPTIILGERRHSFGREDPSIILDTATERQASISANSPSDNAACLVELSVFGVSSFRR